MDNFTPIKKKQESKKIKTTNSFTLGSEEMATLNRMEELSGVSESHKTLPYDPVEDFMNSGFQHQIWYGLKDKDYIGLSIDRHGNVKSALPSKGKK